MTAQPPSEPIAIIGMACIFPGAPNLQRYWDNIVNGVDAISEVPEQRWASLFYDPDSGEVDRFYCRRGGFVDDYVDFDPLKYGVMPRAAASADPDQLLSLRVGIEALEDAGYASREFPRERCGVIIGRGNYLSAGTLRLEQHVRLVQQLLQTLQELFPALAEEQLQAVREQIRSKLDYYGPDVAIGMIPNLVASRLANRLDLQGPAYTVDAACASSLLAIEQACESLRVRQTDMMLAGGLHFTHDLTFWATFCQLGALSRSQVVRPFSAAADGILAGEGIGMLVLKRQADAERDGDRIYALINGVASASDGRSSSLMAPSVTGQLLALQRAWQQTDLQRDRLGLLEAHGTGTPAGDQAELQTVQAFFGAWQPGADEGVLRPVLGSVKSMIGHTMPAAGVAGVIKAALAVYHGVLPPTLHCEQPHELLAATRFRVLGKREPWPQQDTRRIAAVNAFGFGGINAHVVLSRYRPPCAAEASEPSEPSVLPRVVTLAADSREELLARLQQQRWDAQSGAGSWRLAIIEPNEKRIELALKVVDKGQAWHGRNQIYFSPDCLIGSGGKLAFVFPGVDSAFEPRAADVAAHFHLPLSEFCSAADPAVDLPHVVLGLNSFNHLMFNVLRRLRIEPDGLAGHSIGEFSAMAAGGMLTQERVDAVMGVLEQDPTTLQVPDVIFLAAACGIEAAQAALEGLEDICVSHDNCPHQVILCGRQAAVETAARRLLDKNVLSQKLPFVSGFHSPMFAAHMQQYRDFYVETELREPDIPVWSATSCSLFPASMTDKKTLALEHLVQPVRFRQLIENMYADGFRAFIQVGTGSLVGFVEDILKHRRHLAISANVAKRSGMEQLIHLLAALWVEGADIDTTLLGFEGARAAAAASPSPSAIKLRLGVPLVKLDRPLSGQGVPAVQGAVLPQDGNDPLQALYNQTMLSIQQAATEIQSLWQMRRKTPEPVTGMMPQPPVTAAATEVPAAPFKRIVRQRLDIDTNIPYVADHELYPQRPGWPVLADRHPVVPLTMEIMLIRDAIEASLPGFVVIRFREVHAFNWLVVDKPTDIDIHLEMKQYPEIEVGIEGYMKAKAVIDTHYPAPSSRFEGQRSGVFERRSQKRTVQFENQRATAIDARSLYADRWMFHGPAYQGVTQLGPIADNGICGRLKVTAGKGALLDNMGQLAGYWVMEQERDCLAMPISVDRVSFYGPDPGIGSEFDCQIWVRHIDGVSCVTDQRLVNAHGQVVITMEGWQTRRYQMDRNFFLQTKQIQQRLVCEVLDAGVVLFHDRYDTAIVRDYLAKRFLNRPEMAEYEGTSPRRRRQWLNGRVAAKDAVREYLWRKHGCTEIFPKELRVGNNAQGQPLISPHVHATFAEQLHVSIAHKDLLALAKTDEKPVGVDIERIEMRSDEFIGLAMTAEEIALLPKTERDEWVARFWVSKEAVAKLAGAGLGGRPKQFCVRQIDGQKLQVNEQWVITRRIGDYIIGWTI
ncbi:Modular polyketide synthase [Sterolibacterium denitrificans]|uniref:Modular polyketide synthase n=1 Tax=Sterolibacterium denitrificans TaxID=157592 RepID=A0A7Z7HQK4_9PROT|nr:beta-ketoacyl synthase N-terminal-like domain-containing protein [Sterolibacterium denitrificans]SMB25369.1 Modular polyketide synthase [Sterolibacterium denitrificans]